MNALLASSPSAILEALCAFEMLWRLDFASDSLFFGVTPSRIVVVQIGGSSAGVAIPCGTLPDGWDFTRAAERWKAIANAMGDISSEELDAIWKASAMRRLVERVVLYLLSRGVAPPALAHESAPTSAAIRRLVESRTRPRS